MAYPLYPVIKSDFDRNLGLSESTCLLVRIPMSLKTENKEWPIHQGSFFVLRFQILSRISIWNMKIIGAILLIDFFLSFFYVCIRILVVIYQNVETQESQF